MPTSLGTWGPSWGYVSPENLHHPILPVQKHLLTAEFLATYTISPKFTPLVNSVPQTTSQWEFTHESPENRLEGPYLREFTSTAV